MRLFIQGDFGILDFYHMDFGLVDSSQGGFLPILMFNKHKLFWGDLILGDYVWMEISLEGFCLVDFVLRDFLQVDFWFLLSLKRWAAYLPQAVPCLPDLATRTHLAKM